MKTLLRWIIGLAVTLLLLGIATGLAVTFLFDPNDYKDDIAALVSEQTGRPFSIEGELNLKAFPCCGVKLGPLTLGNPPGFPAGIHAAIILSTGEVVPFTAPTLCEAACSSDGQFQFSLAGVPGCSYAIQVSTDLSHWTVLQITNSPFTFTDTNTSSFPRRFYRAQYLP